MKKTTQEVINEMMEKGFSLVETGTGSYFERFNHWKSSGYVVGAWYTGKNPEGERVWEIYVKEKTKSQKKVESPKIDYSALTVKELKSYCQQKKVAKYSKMNKEQMIAALQVC